MGISDRKLQNPRVILLLSLLLMATIVEAKVLNCRPLPQCCRRFVFSPACRGVAAKRNLPATVTEIDNFFRDPRLIPVDLEYGNGLKSLPDGGDTRSLGSILTNAAEELDNFSS